MEKSYDIYKSLVSKYNNLSEIEKQAILIYKSRLFNLFNLITSIPNFKDLTPTEIMLRLPNIENLEEDVKKFNDILELKENMIIKYSVFKLVNMSNFEALIDDLKRIYFILEGGKEKIVLDRDLTVYRGISLDNSEELVNMARGNIISTSIKLDDVEKFLFLKKKAFLYVIRLKKGTPLLVAPISLIKTYIDVDDCLDKMLKGIEPTKLELMNRGVKGQQEVIIFKDELNIINERIVEKDIDGEKLTINYIDTEPVRLINKERKIAK